ncbi:MAG: hypothetical protein HGB26_06685 [Desulfobulbaceae bacterium]|nr:hypothetical protein [Desulfobulbaceae bacterium]
MQISTSVGGLVGYNSFYSTISNSYSTGNIMTAGMTSGVGGLVGENTFYSTISNSYSTGGVTVGLGGTFNSGVGGLSDIIPFTLPYPTVTARGA